MERPSLLHWFQFLTFMLALGGCGLNEVRERTVYRPVDTAARGMGVGQVVTLDGSCTGFLVHPRAIITLSSCLDGQKVIDWKAGKEAMMARLEIDFRPADLNLAVLLLDGTSTLRPLKIMPDFRSGGFMSYGGCPRPGVDSINVMGRHDRLNLIMVKAKDQGSVATKLEKPEKSLCTGDSGGPVMQAGRVFGVSVASIEGAANYHIWVPIEPAIDHLRALGVEIDFD